MTRTETNTLAALRALAAQGIDSPTAGELARAAGHGVAPITQALRNLRAAGWIRWEYPDYHLRRFTVYDEPRPGRLSNQAALTLAALNRIQAQRKAAGRFNMAHISEVRSAMPPTGPRALSGIRSAFRELQAAGILTRSQHSRYGFHFRISNKAARTSATLATLADPPS